MSDGKDHCSNCGHRAGPDARTDKPIWNSLERAKLGVGLLTPIALAGLGLFLSLGAEQRSEQRTIAAERRSDGREIAAQKRSFDWQESAEGREVTRSAAARNESKKLTIQMADLANSRDTFVRAQSARREDLALAQAAALEQRNRIIERRSRIWDELGPKLNDIYAYSMRKGDWKKFTAAQILQTKRECDRIFYSYLPFFTMNFSDAYLSFMEAAFQTYVGQGQDALIKTSPVGRNDLDASRFDPSYAEDQSNSELEAANARLLFAAANSLGLDGGAF